MNKGLISVVVPIYNVENYLDKCIESIVSQTYENIEIILVDDGSKDNSSNIADIWSSKDNRIKVYHKKNGGLSDARNYGKNRATGEYICFIDSDDYIEKNMLKDMIGVINKYDVDYVACNYFIDDGESIIKKAKLKNEIYIIDKKDIFNSLYNEFQFLSVIACNKLYRTKLLLNIDYPVGKVNEDEFVIYDLMAKSSKIAYLNSCLYYYVKRNNSIMHTFNMKRLEVIEVYETRANEFYKQKMKKTYYYTRVFEFVTIANLIAECIKCNDSNLDKKISELKMKCKKILAETKLFKYKIYNKNIFIKLLIAKINFNLLIKIILNRKQ